MGTGEIHQASVAGLGGFGNLCCGRCPWVIPLRPDATERPMASITMNKDDQNQWRQRLAEANATWPRWRCYSCYEFALLHLTINVRIKLLRKPVTATIAQRLFADYKV